MFSGVYAKRVGLFFILAFAYSIILSFSYSSAATYVCPNHVGSMFKMAVDVANGLTLYGQTYSQYGPVPTWIQALALSIFSHNVIVSAMTTMLFAFATIFLLQLVWSRVLTFPYVAIAIVLQAIIQPDVSLPWPNAYMGCFSAATLLAIISYFEKPLAWKLVVAGLSTAAVILCRQQGVVLFLFVFMCLLFLFKGPHKSFTNRATASFWYFLGTFIPIAVYLMYLQSKHMLVDFYKQTILIIPIAYTSGDLSLINHLKMLLNNFFLADRLFFISLWGIIGLICVCSMVVLLFKRSLEEPKSRVIFLCAGFALVGMLNAYPLPDDFRYAHGMAPATGILIYLLYIAFSNMLAPLRFISVLLVISVMFSPVISYVYKNYHAGIRFLKKGSINGYARVSVPTEIAGTFHTPENVQFYTKLDRLLSQYSKLYPETSLISLGVEPLFATFIHNNKNAHQMPFLWWSKTGTMNDGGENNTINALLYPDYFLKLHAFIAQNKPLLYTYGQHIDGYKPIFENIGGVGFPLYWANQWVVRPIVSIQAPIDRADKFLASTNTTEFFNVPERVVVAKVLGRSSSEIQAEHSLENLFDSRLDTFMSYTSKMPFELELKLQLQKSYTISKITLYPRGGYEKLLPRYITISSSLDGSNWSLITASYSDTINATQHGAVFSFKPKKIKFLRISMNSLENDKDHFVQISQIILD